MAKKTSYSEPHQLPQTLTGTVAILLTISAVRYQKQSFDLQKDPSVKTCRLEPFYLERKQVVSAEEELLGHFPKLEPQMTLLACLLDLPAHITAQHVCTSQSLLFDFCPSTKDPLIPFLSLHSTISTPVKLHEKNYHNST